MESRIRNLAKGAATNPNTPTKDAAVAPAEFRPEVVSLSQFVPMAESIAKSESTVRISTGMIKLFRRCIQARSDTGKWYQANGDDEDDEGGHSHFISVLQQALQVLIPAHDLQELEKKQFNLAKMGQNNADVHTITITNAFGKLEIDDIDEEALNAMPDAVIEAGTTRKTPQYEAEDDGSEWLYALHCLWDDVHDLLQQVKDMWKEYLDGRLALTTVCVATNTAVDLVRRIEHEFVNGPSPPEYYINAGMNPNSDLPYAWFAECCIRDEIGDPPKGSKEFIVPIERWEQVEESFFLESRILQTSSTKMMYITRPMWTGVFDPKLDLTKATSKQKYHQASAILMDAMVTLKPFMFHGDSPLNDELLKGFRNQLTISEVPLWLVFATKAYVEIQYALASHNDRPFNDLVDYAREARRTLRGHEKWTRKHALPVYRTDDAEERVAMLHDEIEEWGLNDKILQILNSEMGTKRQRAENKRSGSQKIRYWKENEILKMHGLLKRDVGLPLAVADAAGRLAVVEPVSYHECLASV